MLIVDAFKRWWEMLSKPKENKDPGQLFGRVGWKSAAEEEKSSKAFEQVAVTLAKPPAPEPPAVPAEVTPKVKPARPLKRRKTAKKP